MYYCCETQVTSHTSIRRVRLLPIPGEVLVSVGDRVEPSQVIAEAYTGGDFEIVPVARQLAVSPMNMGHYVRVKVGDSVEKGQVLARRRGLSARTVRAPIDGTVRAAGTGRILLEGAPTLFQLSSYVPGTVSDIIENQGIVIDTAGALVQCAWGTGGESYGVLKCLTDGPNEPVIARMIDPSCHGAVLVGGSGLDSGALEQAAEFQVRGLVLGSLPAEFVDHAQEAPFPVLVTEGIGELPMLDKIFHLLQKQVGHEVSISGKTTVRWGRTRPEIVIPLGSDGDAADRPRLGVPMQVGDHVRIVRDPYLGQSGTVTEIPSLARAVKTGGRQLGAMVDLGRNEAVFVPLANLDALR